MLLRLRDIILFILALIAPALSQVAALIALFIFFILEVVGIRFRQPPRVKSDDQFPYTELTENFSDSGSTILTISGAKPLDAAIFVYADFYPYHGKKTFLPQTRLFTALNRDESYEIHIPWQLFQGAELWSVSRLDIQVGNDMLFGGTHRTPAVMRLASKCLEFQFEPASKPFVHLQAITALGRVVLSCRELEKKGRPILSCTYQGSRGPVIRLARSETEKDAQISLDIVYSRSC